MFDRIRTLPAALKPRFKLPAGNVSRLSAAISIAALLGFVGLAASLARSVGLCCGDDAYFAIVAKNLAQGRGYLNTPVGAPAGTPEIAFDTYVTTGPTSIVPAALFIRLLGNTYWAPSLANVFVWAAPLILLGLLVRRYNAGMGYALSSLAFVYLCYALMARQFEQWWTLLGEIPAAIFLALGVFSYFHSPQKRGRAMSGAALALAVLAKGNALLTVAAFFLAFALILLRDRVAQKERSPLPILQNAGFFALGFLLPFALFEAWKFVALGPGLYLQRSQALWAYAGSVGLPSTGAVPLAGLFSARAATLLDGFGLSLPVAVLGLVVVWILIRRDERLTPIYVALVSAVAVNTVWYLFLSSRDWPRYYVIGLILMIVALCLPFLASPPRKIWVGYALLILLFPVFNWDHFTTPVAPMDRGFLRPSSRTIALTQVARLLQDPAGRGEPIVTQYWGTADDIEYMLPGIPRIENYQDVVSSGDRPYWIAVNTWLLDRNDSVFMQLLKDCKGLRNLSAYLVGECR